MMDNWKCDKCGEEFKTKRDAEKHEKNCGKKSDTRIIKMIKNKNTKESPECCGKIMELKGGYASYVKSPHLCFQCKVCKGYLVLKV